MDNICLSTVTGLPQLTMPLKNKSCPIGLSIVAPKGFDKALIQIVETLEKTFLGYQKCI